MSMSKINKIVKHLEFKCLDNEMQIEEIKKIKQAIIEQNEIAIAISLGKLEMMINIESSDFQKYEKVLEIEEILLEQNEMKNQSNSFEDMDLSIKAYCVLKDKRIKECSLTNLN